MEFLQSHLLSLILFSPAVGALLILVLPKEKTAWIRWAAFLISLIPFGLSLWLWAAYDPSQPGYQFVEQAAWYPTVRSSYHVGVDGISVSMVLLTTLLTPLSLLISWSIAENVRSYMVLFLLLETGMLGVFLALDLLLFFVFWEVGLVPMYFLINQWGGKELAPCRALPFSQRYPVTDLEHHVGRVLSRGASRGQHCVQTLLNRCEVGITRWHRKPPLVISDSDADRVIRKSRRLAVSSTAASRRWSSKPYCRPF